MIVLVMDMHFVWIEKVILMNRTNIFNYLKEKWKLLFCYLLIFLGILLIVIVLIVKPIKKTTHYVYSQSEASDITEMTFPLEEKITIHHDKLANIWIYLEDESINEYTYEIELTNSKDEVYFENRFENYNSNIINIGLGLLEESEGETFNLKIKCDECEDVKIAKSTAIDDSYIVGDNDNTLKIYYQYYVYNNTFYWYAIMAIVLGIIFIPFAKEKHDE